MKKIHIIYNTSNKIIDNTINKYYYYLIFHETIDELRNPWMNELRYMNELEKGVQLDALNDCIVIKWEKCPYDILKLINYYTTIIIKYQ